MADDFSGAFKRLSLNLTNSVATTPAINYEGFAGANLLCPATASSTSITIYVGDGAGNYDADFVDQSATALGAITVAAGKRYEIPHCIWSCGDIKIVTSADDSNLKWILEMSR